MRYPSQTTRLLAQAAIVVVALSFTLSARAESQDHQHWVNRNYNTESPKAESTVSDNWWKTVGDPLLLTTRNCVSRYAGANANNSLSDSDVISKAFDNSCSVESNLLVTALARAFPNEEALKTAFAYLMTSVLIPAVHDARESAHNRSNDQTALLKEVQEARWEKLKACLIGQFSSLSNRSSESAEAIAAAVLSVCQGELSDVVEAGLKIESAKTGRLFSKAEEDEVRQAVAERMRPSIIAMANRLRAGPPQDAGPKSTLKTGTGIVVSTTGHILTNQHVIDGCRSVTIKPIGGLPVTAAVVAEDARNDLALLKAAFKPAGVARIGAERLPRAGDPVVVYGFPFTGALASSGNVVTGNIAALAGLGDDGRFFQISAPVQAGNSGGPLLDARGNVIGVVNAKLDAARALKNWGDLPQNVNFAIKANLALNFLQARAVPLSFPDSTSSSSLDVGDIGEKAKSFTVLIVCSMDGQQQDSATLPPPSAEIIGAQ